MKPMTLACLTMLAAAMIPRAGMAAEKKPAIPGKSDDRAPVDSDITLADQVTDPLLGNWQGQWATGTPRELAAQVIPRGDGKYEIVFLPTLFQRCPPYATCQLSRQGNALSFEHPAWSGRVTDDTIVGTGQRRGKSVAFEIRKTSQPSPTLGAKPPRGAVVLFDGGNLDQWTADERRGGGKIGWLLIDDFARSWPPLTAPGLRTSIQTERAFGDFELHLEFRLPLMATATGQKRANSGVIIEEFDFYEVQILDSFGLNGYWDECGAIYNKEAPKVNACAPPGQWQTYDIVYRSPRLDGSGKLLQRPRLTVNHNGILVHNDVELPYSEKAVTARLEDPQSRTPGRITLQHHGDPIDFRNIWLKPR